MDDFFGLEVDLIVTFGLVAGAGVIIINGLLFYFGNCLELGSFKGIFVFEGFGVRCPRTADLVVF